MALNLTDALDGSTNEYKVILIGAVAVGKTSLLVRYVHNQFRERMSTVIGEKEKTVAVDGQQVHLKIWDTAGQERYQSITNRFYAETKAVVVVYDILNEDSWTDVDFWVKELHYYLPAELEAGMPVLFLGNKKDLVNRRDTEQRTVSFKQVQEVANAYGFMHPLEVSAKTGHNVEEAFTRLVRHLLTSNRDLSGQPDGPGKAKPPRPPGTGCCSLS